MNNFEFQNTLISAIYEASPEGILVVDKQDNIVSHNQKFIDIWRIPNELLNGEAPSIAVGLSDVPILSTVLKRVKHPEYFVARVNELYKNPNLIDYCEIELLDGRTVERHSTVLYSKNGELLGRVWFFRDITLQKETEANLRALTFQDPLTGVANRRYFFEVANQEFNRTKRYPTPLSIALLDIDHFKQINDKYGHGVGDEVLKTVSHCIQSLLRQVDVFARISGADVFARIGGEEFAVLLPNTDINQAIHLAERLRQRIAEKKFFHEMEQFGCTLSIGIAMIRNTDTCAEDCMERADKAMYSAKQNGRNRVEIETLP